MIVLRGERNDLDIRRSHWKPLYHFPTCLCVLSADIIQGNHVKLKKLLLFKPKQQRHKQFSRWKEIWGRLIQLFIFTLEAAVQRVSLLLPGISQPSLDSEPGRNHALLNPYLVRGLASLISLGCSLHCFFIPFFYRIIPLRDWRKQMRYWKASNF